MCEEEWLECRNPDALFDFLCGKMRRGWPRRSILPPFAVSERKLRLYTCACCRRISGILDDERSQQAIVAAERYADWTADPAALEAAHTAAVAVVDEILRVPANPVGTAQLDGGLRARAWACRAATEVSLADRKFIQAVESVVQAATYIAVHDPAWSTEAASAAIREWLLRDIFGNPFQALPPLPEMPANVCNLAESLYAGEECVFALHDALLEGGQVELAEHFGGDAWHPKGCWALDQILGKS